MSRVVRMKSDAAFGRASPKCLLCCRGSRRELVVLLWKPLGVTACSLHLSCGHVWKEVRVGFSCILLWRFLQLRNRNVL